MASIRAEQLERTRKAILEAATTLFLQNGYRNTATREIAKAVGMTQPAMYHHFSDKQTLFLEVIDQVGKRASTEMNATLDQGGTPLEQLTRVTKVLLTIHPRDVFTLIHQSFLELAPENRQRLGQMFAQYYLAPIERFFSQKDLPVREGLGSADVAQFYLMGLGSLFSRFHHMGMDKELDQQIDILLNMVLFGILKQ